MNAENKPHVSLKEIAARLNMYEDGGLAIGNAYGLAMLILNHCHRNDHKEHVRYALKRTFDDLIDSRANNSLCGND